MVSYYVLAATSLELTAFTSNPRQATSDTCCLYSSRLTSSTIACRKTLNSTGDNTDPCSRPVHILTFICLRWQLTNFNYPPSLLAFSLFSLSLHICVSLVFLFSCLYPKADQSLVERCKLPTGICRRWFREILRQNKSALGGNWQAMEKKLIFDTTQVLNYIDSPALNG